MEKMEAHRRGKLHRAFSIFIFNSNNQLLLQRRAFGKYHSGGLWTNTCCSHPRVNEELIDAAKRRLNEEMGMKVELREIFSFIYKANLDSNLIENEFDHVFMGVSDDAPILNLDEAIEYKWICLDELIKDIGVDSNKYTYWLKWIIKEGYLEKGTTNEY